MKSARACPLITALEWNSMSNSPSSIAQVTSLPERSSFCRTFFSGYSVNTRIACAWKYGFNFRAETIKANANFCIQGYLSSAPRRVRLVKYTGLYVPYSSRTKEKLIAEGEIAR